MPRTRSIVTLGVALAVAVLAIVSLPRTRPPERNAAGYYDLTAPALAEMLGNADARDGAARGDALVLVNVHVPYAGEIAGTALHIPYDEITAQLGRLPDRDAPIVLYCLSGGMSASAARDLVRLGYTNVWELNGGMNAWEAAGYALADS